VEGGYKKECSNPSCISHTKVENYSYPRLDPVVITLVEHPSRDMILVGRNKNWPVSRYSILNRYSLVAGFMEPGETLEEAAIREVYEETGIECDAGHVTYVTSQPWPFPSQLMLGFID
jgi:NAD+ diphosphatase